MFSIKSSLQINFFTPALTINQTISKYPDDAVDRRNEILNLISGYNPGSNDEVVYKELILDFIKANHDIGRNNEIGHITGSAFVVDKARSKVLLNHHLKLDKWMQFGGHLEYGESVMETAGREAAEETGIVDFRFLSDSIFDIDVHEIPDYKTQKSHLHFDIRYLIEADTDAEFRISEESKNIEWIDFNDVGKYTDSESVLRMVRKIISMNTDTP